MYDEYGEYDTPSKLAYLILFTGIIALIFLFHIISKEIAIQQNTSSNCQCIQNLEWDIRKG